MCPRLVFDCGLKKIYIKGLMIVPFNSQTGVGLGPYYNMKNST